MSEKMNGGSRKHVFSEFNEKICFSKEISSIGSVGTVRLLKGGAAKILNYIGRIFAYASTRTYGSFMLSFGLASLLLRFAEFYFQPERGDTFSYITISAAVALLGIPLLLFDRPMCIALQDFPVTDYLFFEFLSIKRMHRETNVKGIKMLFGIFLGFIPAVTSFFIPIQYVLLMLLLLILTLVAFTTPEFPMILMILALPYISALPYSEIVLVSISGIAFASYALKVILGKRVYNFSLYDIIIIALGAAALLSGIFGEGDGSIKNSLVFIAILLAYFPANNLIVNRRLADLAVNAVVISSIPISVLAIIEFIAQSPRIASSLPKPAAPGLSVFFSSPEALSAFLLVSAVLSIAYAIEKRHAWKKTLYLGVFILEAFVLGLTMQPFVWLAVLLGIPAYFIITSKKLPLDLLSFIILLPLVIFAFPAGWLDKVYEFLNISPSFSATLAGYIEALGVFRNHLWLGVGIGDAGYNAASGSLSGGIFNTPLAISVHLGVFALILSALLVLTLLRKLSYFRRFMTNSAFITIKNMSALAITVLLIFGMGAHIFDDNAVLCLFFIVFGISNAAMRSARMEHDDRLSYYGDSRSAESSVIDIDLR